MEEYIREMFEEKQRLTERVRELEAEPARIRQELLNEMGPWTRWDFRAFRKALDRIIPEP